jgi:hypothetical protein
MEKRLAVILSPILLLLFIFAAVASALLFPHALQVATTKRSSPLFPPTKTLTNAGTGLQVIASQQSDLGTKDEVLCERTKWAFGLVIVAIVAIVGLQTLTLVKLDTRLDNIEKYTSKANTITDIYGEVTLRLAGFFAICSSIIRTFPLWESEE